MLTRKKLLYKALCMKLSVQEYSADTKRTSISSGIGKNLHLIKLLIQPDLLLFSSKISVLLRKYSILPGLVFLVT